MQAVDFSAVCIYKGVCWYVLEGEILKLFFSPDLTPAFRYESMENNAIGLVFE